MFKSIGIEYDKLHRVRHLFLDGELGAYYVLSGGQNKRLPGIYLVASLYLADLFVFAVGQCYRSEPRYVVGAEGDLADVCVGGDGHDEGRLVGVGLGGGTASPIRKHKRQTAYRPRQPALNTG